MPLLFCNICWMREYKGHHRMNGPEDQPQRGGRWVLEHGTAHECCNFLPGESGIVYGHVETWRGDDDGYDTQIRIENLGANSDDPFVDDVDVIWTATHENGGRRVVGWYRNARVFRQRQHHNDYPTEQHERDKVNSYRIRASQENVHLITENRRNLRLGTGRGWPGHSPLFYPSEHNDNEELSIFLQRLKNLINGESLQEDTKRILTFNPESCGESTVHIDSKRQMRRIHGKVVNELFKVLVDKYGERNIYNNQFIDIAVTENGNLQKLYEIKTGNDKQSIYTGIGQLIFHSGAKSEVEKILVLPQSDDGYEGLYELFDEMGIWISEYSIDQDNEEVIFEDLPD